MANRLRSWGPDAACLLLGATLLAACGGKELSAADLPNDVRGALGGLEEEQRKTFLEARRQQEDALKSTADLVSRAASAGPRELEQGMIVLNEALMGSRAAISAVRRGGQANPVLLRDLRQANARLREAYAVLLKVHPNPSPELLKGGHDSDP